MQPPELSLAAHEERLRGWPATSLRPAAAAAHPIAVDVDELPVVVLGRKAGRRQAAAVGLGLVGVVVQDEGACTGQREWRLSQCGAHERRHAGGRRRRSGGFGGRRPACLGPRKPSSRGSSSWPRARPPPLLWWGRRRRPAPSAAPPSGRRRGAPPRPPGPSRALSAASTPRRGRRSARREAPRAGNRTRAPPRAPAASWGALARPPFRCFRPWIWESRSEGVRMHRKPALVAPRPLGAVPPPLAPRDIVHARSSCLPNAYRMLVACHILPFRTRTFVQRLCKGEAAPDGVAVFSADLQRGRLHN